MASTLSYYSLNPSVSAFSTTHFSVPLYKGFSMDISPSVSYKSKQMKKLMIMPVKATVLEAPPSVAENRGEDPSPQKKQLRVLVAGGGIGGLVFALAAKRKGFEVLVFEKDLSAIRGEGQYRGPIQIQSNALAALEAIDFNVAEEIMRVGCITGDRINGLVDGISGSWYIKFDTFTPAVERGLPVTRVISRMALQEILADAVGEDVIMNASNVVDFVDHGNKVTVVLEDGQKYDGHLLVGADGIWSKVRTKLFGETEATYSGYTCYTGIADFVPADIESVGYRVFLGHKQYFVSSDVGAGKMQWYAFHQEPAGGVDNPNGKKERLLKIFGGWCDKAIDLIVATEEEAIMRRDIYDRTPTLKWGKGLVTLLGDSVHAMQPNMGQGGGMAIEDGYQLALELDNAWQQSLKSGSPIDLEESLKRASIIHSFTDLLLEVMSRSSHVDSSSHSSLHYCGHEVTWNPSNVNTPLSWSPPRCCGKKATVYMSKTEANPDKEFFGCPNFKRYQQQHCSYFLWLDEFFETRNHIENQQKKIMHLERDLEDMKMTMSELEDLINKIQVHRQGSSKGKKIVMTVVVVIFLLFIIGICEERRRTLSECREEEEWLKKLKGFWNEGSFCPFFL